MLNQYVKNFLILAMLFFTMVASAQINFAQSDLDFKTFGPTPKVTSLTFGPDGRLYVLDLSGEIFALTIQRNAANDYIVTNKETITGVKSIPNHDDDGSACSSTAVDCSKRQALGLAVTGTATNPVLYVTSSDARIGGGAKGDVNLDTNSGIITRLSWTGTTWDVVDIVRGLPRSEENHSTNGLEFITINSVDYLIVSEGGNANASSPSKWFAYLNEYALSGAILSVNLNKINALAVSTDAASGRKYIYDIPTLDDPSRPNVNGITDPDATNYDGKDVNDPFGGNDGLNQAMLVPNGPVQIFSPGFRNSYDLVITKSGAVYATDNGSNATLGGLPIGEGTANVSNNYDANQTGGKESNPTADGEFVDNKDHVQLITNNVNSYTFGSFYGGHANPIRANPTGAGLFTTPQTTGLNGALFRTQKYDPDGSTSGSITNAAIALPANWPPVNVADPRENDFRAPGHPNPDGPDDNPLQIMPLNSNGIDEYTASNFGGAMKGNLLVTSNKGRIHRLELKADGTLDKYTEDFLDVTNGYLLGITCNDDDEIFPGTIWVGGYEGVLKVLEPTNVQSVSFPLRINAGGPELDYNGNTFIKDQYFDGGIQYLNNAALVSDLYKTERFDNDKVMEYKIPVPNGLYTVNLHFAEIYIDATGGGTGQRIFDVSIEENLVLDNYDIIADVGTETPVIKTFDVNVTDGELTINFSSIAAVGGLDNPKINAIEVFVNENLVPKAIASATPVSGNNPLEVVFSGLDSADDTGVVKYSWDFKDGSALATTANPTHTFTTAGIYEVELTVEDTAGLKDTDIVIIRVTEKPNEAPVAIIGATPQKGITPLEVNFTSKNATDDVEITAFEWDFNDGSPKSTENNPKHIFKEAGVYNVTLKVTDAENLTDTATIGIVVMGNDSNKITGKIIANPAKDVAQVSLLDDGFGTQKVLRVYLHDASGRLIGTYLPNDIIAHGLYEIPTATLENGIYYIGFKFVDGEKMILTLVVNH